MPLKLGIAVVVIFGFVALGMLLWKPIKVRYYAAEYAKCKDAKERIRIADILINCGDSGKKALYEAFREFCISEQVKIPAGSFMMGSDKGRDDEKPVHAVKLSGFWMDRYEVTNEKYYIFVKLTERNAPQHWQNGKIPEGKELHPVTCVSWEDAKAYAGWLGMKLPTEAQWEYACRAGSTMEYCFGDDETGLDEYAWYHKNAWEKGIREPLAVGRKKPSKWGLYDMHGNLWEWCADFYGDDYYGNSPSENPKGPESGQLRVLRSGGWTSYAYGCRSAGRLWDDPDPRVSLVGFRVSCPLGR